MAKSKSNFGTILLDFFEITIIASAVVFAVLVFIGQVLVVSGTSMKPTINDQEQLLAEKITYKYTEPKRGDIVVFKHPGEEDVLVVKRIVGLGGETITIKEGKVFINQKVLEEPYLQESTTTTGREKLPDNLDFTIPEGTYIVLGDNRAESLDSRNWGLLPKDLVVGKSLLIFNPLSKIRLIKQ